MSRRGASSPGPTLRFEEHFWQAGIWLVAGLDEVGRGCWAGPVVAGAVVLPHDRALGLILRAAGVHDSKRLAPARREALVPLIESVALGVGIGAASPQEIDALGIAPAARLAMQRGLAELPCRAEALLLDAFRLREVDLPQEAIIRGDAHSLSIAAASIVAKVHRDRLMAEVAEQYPHYGFQRHKGYGTAEHQQALRDHGATPWHRMSWAPLQGYQLPLPLADDQEGHYPSGPFAERGS